jgi:uncharacterized protein (TIGR03435 family)
MVRRSDCGRSLRAGLLLLAAAGFVAGLPAQAPAAAQPADANAAYVPTLTFDVASIRESPRSDSYTVRFENPPHSSLVRLTNNTLMNVISMAYDVRRSQIAGAPDWAQSTFYMIEAKSDSATDEKLAKLSDAQAWLEKQHMMQVLLADRFQLKARWETRESTIYNLMAAKGGPKLSSELKPPSPEEVARFGNNPVPSIYQRGDGQLGYQFIGHGATMDILIPFLAGQMGANVIDKTGLKGKYDFTLKYSGTVPGTESQDPHAWALLITALPEQLGLKLEPARGPDKFLVIDHIEKPSPN